MKKLDCFGEICPIPIMKIKKAYSELLTGDTLLATTDHICVVESVEAFLASSQSTYSVTETMTGVWEITIIK